MVNRVRMFWSAVLGLGLVGSGAWAQSTVEGDAVQMEAFTVSDSRVSASEIEGPQSMDTYDPAYIDSTGAFSVNEFIGSLPDPEEGTTTLVLIDGRPTYLDPSSLPLGMIAQIEVSEDGSMPQYGEFHNGRIINIRLKPDYTSTELGAKYEDSWAGGGAQSTARLSGATNRDKLRAIYSVEFSESRPLLATERAFSRDQDHRPDGGRDLRLAWGQPAVVVAQEGTLHGVTDADGNPVSTALVPAGQNGEGLLATRFLPPDPLVGDLPSGQRRFNTAAYRWLVSPSQSVSANLGFSYAISDRFQASVNASHRDSRGERIGSPPVSTPSKLTVVPAAYNPFNQDVSVGMVHEAFGPTRQDTRSQQDQVGLQLKGELPGDWRWEASAGYRRNTSQRTGEELDPLKLAAALSAVDPAQRFNPFADTRVFDPNAALYPTLTSTRTRDDTAVSFEYEASLRGTVFELPAGEAQLNVKASYDEDDRDRRTTRTLGETPERDRFRQDRHQLSSSLQLPLFGKPNARPWLRRLDLHLSGQYSASSTDSRETEGEVGAVWAPLKSLSFRARVDHSVERPDREVIAGSETLIGETLIDPRRGGEPITAVRVFNRETVTAVDEQQQRYSVGVTFEPPALPGLEFKLNYRERTQRGIFEDDFEAQDIVNNEQAFAGRVQRAAPTAADLAAGQPGQIVAVDLTPGSTGSAGRKDLEFEINYRLPELPSGNWRFKADVDRYLGAHYDILPGVPFVSEGGSRYRRPPWRANARLSWSRGTWNASAYVRHTAALPADDTALNAIGRTTTWDLNMGRRWRLREAGPNHDRIDLKLNLSVENLFDQDPPRADTVAGYRGGSPLGRTYSGALTVEF